MKATGVLLIILGLIAIGLVILNFSSGSINEPKDNQILPDDAESEAVNSVVGQTESWQTYQTADFINGWGLRLNYPNEVEMSEPTEQVITFKYIGPASEPNTEINDGFLVTIQGEAPITPDAYVQMDEVTSEINKVEFNEYEALSYQTTSELGEQINHLVFKLETNQLGKGTVIDIAANVSGAQTQLYNNTIETILETLNFTQTN